MSMCPPLEPPLTAEEVPATLERGANAAIAEEEDEEHSVHEEPPASVEEVGLDDPRVWFLTHTFNPSKGGRRLMT